MWQRLAVLSVAVGAPASLVAQSRVANPHATITLVPEVATLAPGRGFTVAIQFEMEPGWHVYWENPGESGIATTVDWGLPDGFRAGPLRYPAPERLIVAGITTHIHRGTAVFAAEVAAPSTLRASRAMVTATVQYGICKDVCYPGRAELRAPLRVSPAGGATVPHAAWAAVAVRLAAGLPATGGLAASYQLAGDTALVTLRATRGCLVGPVTFFPRQREVAPAAAVGPGVRGCGAATTIKLPLIAPLAGPLRGVARIGAGPSARAIEVAALGSR